MPRFLSVLLLVALIMLSFPAPAYTQSQENNRYWPTDGWRTSSPEAQGMESKRLADMLAYIDEMDIDVHGVVVIRNGYLIAEAYRYPYQPDTPHNLQSCTKSVASALIGIAIQQGLIESVHQPVIDLFPEHHFANLDDAKRALRLDHVLTMQSGLPLEGAVPNEALLSENLALAILDLPLRTEPGEKYLYNGLASQVLVEIVAEMSGKPTLDFATEYLFEPLGIEQVIWDPMGAEGHVSAGTGLWLTPRDLAKFGYLYARNGEWDGVHIVSPEWVTTSTAIHVRNPAFGGNIQADGYGYQWWVDDAGYYMALGAAGQVLIVKPDLDLIATFTSGLRAKDTGIVRGMFDSFILPAVQSENSLPEDRAALAKLDASVHSLAQPDPADVPPLPPTAEHISGQTYALEDNDLGKSSLMLHFEPGMPQATLTIDAEAYNVGLDDVFRVTTFESGTRALMKGRWIDSNYFEVEWGTLGDPYHWQILFRFEDATLSARFSYHGYVEQSWRLTGLMESRTE